MCFAIGCDNGWYRFQEACYKVFNQDEYYADAAKICRSMRATMASISSANENHYVRNLVAKFTIYDEAWLGLRGVDGSFAWEDGTLLVYDNWMLGKPLNKKTDCVEMVPDGYWNNINCYNRIPFICKKGEQKSFI